MGYYTNIRPQKNDYINYKSVSNKIISCLMIDGNYMLRLSDYFNMKNDLIKLFGIDNIKVVDTSSPKFVIIEVTDQGKENCEKMQIMYKETTN